MIWYSYLKAKKKNFKSIAREKKLDSKFENKKDDGKTYAPNVGLETATLRLRVSCSTD